MIDKWGDHFNLQSDRKLIQFQCYGPFPTWILSEPVDPEWILDLTVVSSFIVASVAGRARSFLKGCRHARVPQPSPSVDTICSSPFWERCLIVLQLVQNCYALIASWLAYDKSDGLKGATQPVLYRVGAASLRPRCSALSLYSELP